MKISGHVVGVEWSLGGGPCLPMSRRTMFFSLTYVSPHQASDLVGRATAPFPNLCSEGQKVTHPAEWPFLHHVCGREGCAFVLIPGLGSVKLGPMREGPPDWTIQGPPPSPRTGARAQAWDWKYGHWTLPA